MPSNAAFLQGIKRFDDECGYRHEKKGKRFALITKALKGRLFWIKALQITFLTLLALFVFTACAGKCELKEIFVPVKCEVTPKIRPLFTNELVEDLRQTLIYTELLEADLRLCLGEKGDTQKEAK